VAQRDIQPLRRKVALLLRDVDRGELDVGCVGETEGDGRDAGRRCAGGRLGGGGAPGQQNRHDGCEGAEQT